MEYIGKIYGKIGKKYFPLEPGAAESKLIAEIRAAFAEYEKSEGCSCCQDKPAHDAASRALGALLGAEPYDDGSGINWAKYRVDALDKKYMK